MSYSFSKRGSVSEVRDYLRNNVSEHQHGARHAKALISAQLDILEAQGATHVDVSAFGHSDGHEHTIKVYRDTAAESEHQKTEAARKFDEWLAHGKSAGHIIQGDAESPTTLLIPAKSKHGHRNEMVPDVVSPVVAPSEAATFNGLKAKLTTGATDEKRSS